MQAVPPHRYCRIVNLLLFSLLIDLPLSLSRPTRPCGDARSVRFIFGKVQKLVDIEPAPLARQVCIVCRRHQTDGLGGTRVEIASAVGALLQLICTQFVLVIHHCIVGRPDSALQSIVRLEIKVETEDLGHALIHDCARSSVAVSSVSTSLCSRVKAGVVSLAANDDSELWAIHCCRRYFLEGLEDLW